MRAFIVATIVVIFANAASAADSSTTQLSFFTSNLSYGQSNGQSQWAGGAGLAISRAWNPHWSTELAVAVQRERGPFTMFSAIGGPSGLLPVTQLRSFTIYPADLTTQYRFFNSSRWTPYVTAGARYVGAPQSSHIEIIPGMANLAGTGWHMAERRSLEAGAGLSVRITPRVGLRLDAMRLLRSDSVNYDPLLRTSIGVSFHF
jgi:opacity protein-like surface antigen